MIRAARFDQIRKMTKELDGKAHIVSDSVQFNCVCPFSSFLQYIYEKRSGHCIWAPHLSTASEHFYVSPFVVSVALDERVFLLFHTDSCLAFFSALFFFRMLYFIPFSGRTGLIIGLCKLARKKYPFQQACSLIKRDIRTMWCGQCVRERIVWFGVPCAHWDERMK